MTVIFVLLALPTALLILLFASIVVVLLGAQLLTMLLWFLCWQRNFWWTFRYRGEPITVFFHEPDLGPLFALIHRRRDNDLVFETLLPGPAAAFGRLSITLDSYGTTWCWGHEGEEVEALKVSRALA